MTVFTGLIVSQMNPTHTHPTNLSKVYFNLTPIYASVFLAVFFLCSFTQKSFTILFFPIRATCLAHLIFDLTSIIILGMSPNSEAPHCAAFSILPLPNAT